MTAPAPEFMAPQNIVFDRTAAFAPAWKIPTSQTITGTTVEYVTAAAPTTWVTTGLGAVSAYSTAGTPGYQWATASLAGGSIGSNQGIVFRVRYTNSLGETSAYAYLSAQAGSTPGTPTITAPAALATVNRLATVTWTTPATQAQYEIEVRTATGGGGSIVYAGSGTSPKTHVVTMDATGVTRYIRVRYLTYPQPPGYEAYNLWSAWQQVQVSTSFVNPATPTVALTLTDPTSIGVSHVVSIAITNPTPSGGQPTVTDNALEYRRQGSSDAWVRIKESTGLVSPQKWRAPSGSWEVRAVAIAASAGTTANGTTSTVTVALRGVILYDPAAPNTAPSPMLLMFNDEGASETIAPESVLVAYAGREFPAVEFGTATSHVVEVGVVTLKTRTEVEQLQALLLDRTVLCYRDKRGRKVYGLLDVSSFVDKFYGYEVGLKVTRLDYAAVADEVTTV